MSQEQPRGRRPSHARDGPKADTRKKGASGSTARGAGTSRAAAAAAAAAQRGGVAKKAAGGKKGKGEVVDEKDLMPSTELAERAVELRAVAERVEAEGQEGITLASTLGERLISDLKANQGLKVVDLFREWDKNSDGKLSKMEFRIAIKAMKVTQDVRAIDGLFGLLDLDGGGDMDVSELTAALARLKQDAGRMKERLAQAQADAAHWRARAERCDKAAALTVEVEEISVRYTAMVDFPKLEYRVSMLLRKNSIQAGNVINRWDKDNTGKLSRANVVRGLRELGIHDPDDDVNEFVDKFFGAGTGGGEIIQGTELRERFKELVDVLTTTQVTSPHISPYLPMPMAFANGRCADNDTGGECGGQDSA